MRARLTACSILLALANTLCASQRFPKGAFSDDKASDGLLSGWYSYELKVLQEPPLFGAEQAKAVESYRFLWLRTFRNPIAVRLDVASDGRGILTVKVANGSSGFPRTQQHLIENISRPISATDTRRFLDHLRRMSFWELSTCRESQGTDGAEWIIEGVQNGRYHLVARWSSEEGEARELGLAFIGLTHLNIPADEIY
jgi:hypothetical protein